MAKVKPRRTAQTEPPVPFTDELRVWYDGSKLRLRYKHREAPAKDVEMA